MDNPAFFTDFYQLTMAYAYWANGLSDRQGVFTLYFRSNPFGGGFTVCAGLETVCELLEGIKFSPSDIAFLASLKTSSGAPKFPIEFLEFLRTAEFECDVQAIPEGTIVFPIEPIVRVRGPIWQCQWLETMLLNTINFQSLIATKTARIVLSARGSDVVEFGLRRAQGVDGGLSASRAAYIGGASATSNVMAAAKYQIPVSGTHSHSWVMSFESEKDAFRHFAQAVGDDSVLLVDTYDTMSGVQNAIDVVNESSTEHPRLRAVRLDSGDFAYLSQKTRQMLDRAGLTQTKIIASNELDEYLIQSLFLQDAKIDLWGVGTRLVTAQDQPSMNGVFKLTAVKTERGWSPRMKVSDQPSKSSNPGVHKLYRCTDDTGMMRADIICDEAEDPTTISEIHDSVVPYRHKKLSTSWKKEPLLRSVFTRGRRTHAAPDLKLVRAHLQNQLASLHTGHKRLENPHSYPVGLSPRLVELKERLIQEHHRSRAAQNSDTETTP